MVQVDNINKAKKENAARLKVKAHLLEVKAKPHAATTVSAAEPASDLDAVDAFHFSPVGMIAQPVDDDASSECESSEPLSQTSDTPSQAISESCA